MDASAVSIRPLYRIEDRPRSKQPDTANRIPRATKERTRAEDTVEVIDRSIDRYQLFPNVSLRQISRR